MCECPKRLEVTFRNSTANRAGGRSHYRWVVCALLFFATTVNYVDRQVLAVLAPKLTEEFGWSETDFSFIVSAFTLAYAIGYLVAGKLMDWIGERKGFAVAVTAWSIAAMAHDFWARWSIPGCRG